MMGGDCGEREDDGCHETINSGDGDNDMFEENEKEKKMTALDMICTINMVLYCYIEYIVYQQNLFALLQLLYTSTITTIIQIMLAKKN